MSIEIWNIFADDTTWRDDDTTSDNAVKWWEI